MLSPYARCNFFSSIRLEDFLSEDSEEELFYSLAGLVPLLYWRFYTGFVVLFACCFKDFEKCCVCIYGRRRKLKSWIWAVHLCRVFFFSLVGNEQCEYSKWPIKWVQNHFFLNFLRGWVVFLLHPLLNTLSLKEASRPQLFLMNFNIWYLLLLVCF